MIFVWLFRSQVFFIKNIYLINYINNAKKQKTKTNEKDLSISSFSKSLGLKWKKWSRQ